MIHPRAIRPVLRASTTLAALAATAAMLSSCTGNDKASTTIGSGTESSVVEFARVFGGYSQNYVAAKSPDELAGWSDLVTTGHIVAITEGRKLAIAVGDNQPDLIERTLVMKIRPDRYVKGVPPVGSDGYLYVELANPGQRDPSLYDAAVPKDSLVALYLIPSQDPMAVDPAAGRPEGQEIWRPITAQGFIVDDGTQSYAILDHVGYGTSLSSFLPPSKAFPQ